MIPQAELAPAAPAHARSSAPRSFVKGLAYRTGDILPLEALVEQGVLTDAVLASLKERGLRNYCQSRDGLAEMALASAVESMASVGLSPAQIDALVFANSSADWTEAEEMALYRALNQAGFVTTDLIGLMMQGCSACGAALRTAANLIAERADVDNVLVIVGGRVLDEKGRLPPNEATIFSDGAASCVVSREIGEYEILAGAGLTNTGLAAGLATTTFGQHVMTSFQNLTQLSRELVRRSEVAASDVALLVGTNGSEFFLTWLAAAAEVPVARTHMTDVPRFAHVHSCDNLISLKNATASQPLQVGAAVLMLSWSPFVLSGVMLRHVAHPPGP